MNILEILAKLYLYPIFDSYQSPSNDDLVHIEQLVGHKLPEDLLLLFENYGCAGFKKATDYVLDHSQFPVSYVLGGGASTYSVLELTKDIQEEEVWHSVPFAGDEFGNIYLYGLSDQMSGIWRWNHENELTLGENPFFVARDLEQFFLALQTKG